MHAHGAMHQKLAIYGMCTDLNHHGQLQPSILIQCVSSVTTGGERVKNNRGVSLSLCTVVCEMAVIIKQQVRNG